MPTRSCPPKSGRQRGSSSVEFILAGIPVLLVGLGAVELSRWFFIKQAISLALLEAGRAGIVDHGRPASIEAAFERALLPLFPPTSVQNAEQRLRRAFDRRQAATGAPPWRIRVIAPDAAAFHDFASSGLAIPGASGLAAIDNDYQAEQHQRYEGQGWVGGRGPLSGATIFEANDLALQLTYMHEPLVPGVGALLRLLSSGSSGYARQALAGGYLPLRQTLRLTMQSHPVAWSYSNPKVVGADAVFTAAPPEGRLSACHGIWCGHAFQPVAGTVPPAGPPPAPSPAPNPPGAPPPTPTPPANPPAGPESPGLPIADDIACGTAVCCLEV
ncbi:TadE family protein [Pusillimonas sp.]|uniref:TadE/TadG family type IV pilus assembly protein n=1 Tax=Pusillimonas sp. TaxID=3040095 RepID=UPI0029B14D8B|nr:TadE family protein [Pusillimonas sp.]MDX3893621.1 pilus assembly protein [Pusillimonas sp.]